MPFAPGLGETDHVLGHEIAHAFQIDIARSVKQNAFTLPGWFIEGMAEYLSLGPATAHTPMWVRDAAATTACRRSSSSTIRSTFPTATATPCGPIWPGNSATG